MSELRNHDTIEKLLVAYLTDIEPRTGLPALRSQDEILTKHGPLDLPAGMPSGPWPSDIQVRGELEEWCRNRQTGGGGWAIRWACKRDPRRNRGVQRVLQCYRATTDRCKWQLVVEESVPSIVVVRGSASCSGKGLVRLLKCFTVARGILLLTV
jgi:hypothetical protein